MSIAADTKTHGVYKDGELFNLLLLFYPFNFLHNAFLSNSIYLRLVIDKILLKGIWYLKDKWDRFSPLL